ncbi:hypothetical protein [Sorangium sp. So ce1153]|uniref:hypothetical protein n=1 Tax=Sorangium sp. So ce1153 TaxID=3133333 RepID=UPI003F646212
MKAGRREEKINDLPAFPPSCESLRGKLGHHRTVRIVARSRDERDHLFDGLLVVDSARDEENEAGAVVSEHLVCVLRERQLASNGTGLLGR